MHDYTRFDGRRIRSYRRRRRQKPRSSLKALLLWVAISVPMVASAHRIISHLIVGAPFPKMIDPRFLDLFR